MPCGFAISFQLTHNFEKDDVDPTYSPDGKKIVYAGLTDLLANDPGGAIYTINVGGGGKVKVTDLTDCDGCYYPHGATELSWGSRP